MTTPQLEEQLAGLKSSREQLTAQLHGLNGAIAVTEHYLTLEDAPVALEAPTPPDGQSPE